eukprot:2620854-Pyramimonas_sp.AAC.2
MSKACGIIQTYVYFVSAEKRTPENEKQESRKRSGRWLVSGEVGARSERRRFKSRVGEGEQRFR